MQKKLIIKDFSNKMKNKVYDLIWQYDENHVAVKQATKQGFILCEYGGVADLSFPTSKNRRGRVQGNGQICPTLMSSTQNIYRIEKVESDSKEMEKIIAEKRTDEGLRTFKNNVVGTIRTIDSGGQKSDRKK